MGKKIKKSMPPDRYLSESSNSISEESKCCTQENILKYCRKFIAFLISRIGLMIVMVGYVLAGGLIFEALESDYENKALELSEAVMEKMLNKIYRQIESNSTRVKDDSFYTFLRHEIRTFGDFFTNATLNGTLTGNIEPQWDFFGSVFYCVTLVSTIGYGHITCKTKFGKIFTIAYSSIGIPLMMLFLANTGSSTATMFKFFYLKINSIKRGFQNRRLSRLKKAAWKNIEFNGTNPNENPLNDIAENENDDRETEKKEDNFFEYKSNLDRKEETKISEKIKNHENNIVNCENEIYDDSKAKKLKKYINASVSVSVGIRDVEIPKEFIQTFVSFNPNQKSNRIRNYKTNLLTIKESCSNKPNQMVLSNESRLFEAIKKIDNLIDQKSIKDDDSDEEETKIENDYFKSEKSKPTPIKGDQTDFRNISLNSIIDESLNSNEALNDDFLISNIFKKSIKRKPQIQTVKKSPGIQKGFKSSSLNENLIRKNNTFNNLNSEPKNSKLNTSQSELVLNCNNTIKTRLLPIKTNAKNLSLQNRTHSAYSTPIFDSNSESNIQTSNEAQHKTKLKRNAYTNRSLYAYDPQTLDRKSSSVRFKSKQLPVYNTKQLSLIYKQYKQERQDRMGVPMLTTLIIMPLYLICGMLIFSSFEKWKKLDALYFCFVTLTTIGFGDIIPGSTLLNKNGNKNNLYISALYIFVGLILIAMCINLMKNQLKRKVKSIARKVGLSNR